QQYGFGYGRLDLIAKHPRRMAGDSASPLGMMLHPPLALAAVSSLLVAALLWTFGGNAEPLALVGVALFLGLAGERCVAGVRAARRFRSLASLHFAWLHLVRDLVWVSAIAAWGGRWLMRTHAMPTHSMRPRPAKGRVRPTSARLQPSVTSRAVQTRVLCLIPAYNEAASLTRLLGELRAISPAVDVLVVDDGSTDETAAVAR